jgi:chromosome segregation ATPase
MLPTPEEEIETMIKDEKKLEESIEEIKEVLKKIEEALESKEDSIDLQEDLEKKKFYYISLLEEFETELQCIKVQHKSMEIVLKDSDDEEGVTKPFIVWMGSLLKSIP